VKAKRIVKLGILALVACGVMALLAVLIDDNVSKNQSNWDRDYGDKKPMVQDIPFKE
jgi:hypothetical protein